MFFFGASLVTSVLLLLLLVVVMMVMVLLLLFLMAVLLKVDVGGVAILGALVASICKRIRALSLNEVNIIYSNLMNIQLGPSVESSLMAILN